VCPKCRTTYCWEPGSTGCQSRELDWLRARHAAALALVDQLDVELATEWNEQRPGTGGTATRIHSNQTLVACFRRTLEGK
jgi:hypothetical protein